MNRAFCEILARVLLVVTIACENSFADSTFIGVTQKIPVTFYDFHQDGSNPDFQRAKKFWTTEYNGRPVLVEKRLGANGKPVDIVDPTKPFLDRIDKWFVPWFPTDYMYVTCAPETVITYTKDTVFECFNNCPPNAICDMGPICETNIYDIPVVHISIDSPFVTDTLFKNVPVEDFLTFYDSSYATRRLRNANGPIYIGKVWDTIQYYPHAWILKAEKNFFFPLDGKGLPDVKLTDTLFRGHNFSFTMEMHNEFVYTGGEFFSLISDDDAWLYINDTLVIDNGGVHISSDTAYTFYPDSLGKKTLSAHRLVKGQTYRLALFYAERFDGGANLFVATNIQLLDQITIMEPISPSTPVTHSSKIIPLQKKIQLGNTVAALPPATARFSSVLVFDVAGRCLYYRCGISPNELAHEWVGIDAKLKPGKYLLNLKCVDSAGKALGKTAVSIMPKRML
jgi:fibro-slime domain-containing protein